MCEAGGAVIIAQDLEGELHLVHPLPYNVNRQVEVPSHYHWLLLELELGQLEQAGYMV